MAIKLLYIDLFCGAGGTTTGVETARIGGKKCAKVIACVNHDANAIASHAANHPVEFQNKTIMFKPYRLELVIGNPVLGKVRIGKKTRKFEAQVMPTYCPFCGKKLREDKKEEGGLK